MRAIKEESAAILIDIQERLLPVMDRKAELITNCVSFISGLRILDVPILAARQYPKGLGDLVAPIRAALGEYHPFDKTSFSVYGSPEVRNYLEETKRKNLFLFGIETHICVLQSVIDLQAAGYQVYLVCDCASSRKPEDHRIALERAQCEGALLTTREAALFELLGAAGSEQFKQISKLVKETP